MFQVLNEQTVPASTNMQHTYYTPQVSPPGYNGALEGRSGRDSITIVVTRTRKQVTQEISSHVQEDITFQGAVKNYHPGNYVL
jgi:hypothetical protein